MASEYPVMARDVLEVELLEPSLSAGAMVWRVFSALIRNAALGVLGSSEVKTEYWVILRDRRVGRRVLEFEHSDAADAAEHLRSLKERLGSMTFWDFCRDAGIDYDTAVRLRGRVSS